MKKPGTAPPSTAGREQQAGRERRPSASIRRAQDQKTGPDETEIARIILENLSDGLWVANRNNIIVYINGIMAEIAGTKRERIIGASVINGFSEETLGDFRVSYMKAKESLIPVDYEAQVVTPAGRRTWQAGRIIPIVRDSLFDGMITTVKDITAAKLSEENRQALAAIVDVSPASITVHDLKGNFLYANDKTIALHGYDRQEFMSLNLATLDTPESRRRISARLKQAAERGWASFEVSHYRKDGTTIPLWVDARRITWKGTTAILSIATDITERKILEGKLQNLAYYDILTKLPNRSLFFDRLVQSLARARRDRTMVAVIYIDLDGFKEVNDTAGHEAGDTLLQTVARQIRSGVRESDTVARIGGDEFVVILPELKSIEKLPDTVGKLLARINKPLRIKGYICQIGASAGTAVFPRDGYDPESLLRHADGRMYDMKHSITRPPPAISPLAVVIRKETDRA